MVLQVSKLAFFSTEFPFGNKTRKQPSPMSKMAMSAGKSPKNWLTQQ
jgi:hypothetical protein